jgi:hypothetical protein
MQMRKIAARSAADFERRQRAEAFAAAHGQRPADAAFDAPKSVRASWRARSIGSSSVSRCM